MNAWVGFWTLYLKEWKRIRRNPSALMSVGLLVIVAYLVSIETKSQETQINKQKNPCVLLYNEKDTFIQRVESEVGASVLLIQSSRALTNQVDFYPKGTTCAAQYANGITETQPQLLLLHTHEDTARIYHLLRKLYEIETHEKKLIKSSILNLKVKEKESAKIDLSTNKSKAMVWTMLLFSLHFFVGCALFISFTAYERERGILQALALTPVSLNVIWTAKAAFHLTLALTASLLMLLVLFPLALANLQLWFLLTLSVLGLISVATIITSLNRTQTSASLVGFCYLMTISVVFSLSQNFPAFAILKQLMFESHAIALLNAIFDSTTRQSGTLVLHFYMLLGLVLILMSIALIIWNQRAQKNS